MPTYEYRCNSCGEHIEVVQSFTDDPLTECALCKGPLKKVFHPVGIVFKGSGFYVTDSKGVTTAASKEGELKAGEKSSGASASKSGEDGKSADSAGTDSKGATHKSTKESA